MSSSSTNIPAQIIARATGVTGNEIFPDSFDFKQITTEPTTADGRPVLDCEGATFLTGQIFGGARGGEDWTAIVVTDHGLLLPAVKETANGLLLPAVRMDGGGGEADIKDGTSNTFMFGEVVTAPAVGMETLTIAHEGWWI